MKLQSVISILFLINCVLSQDVEVPSDVSGGNKTVAETTTLPSDDVEETTNNLDNDIPPADDLRRRNDTLGLFITESTNPPNADNLINNPIFSIDPNCTVEVEVQCPIGKIKIGNRCVRPEECEDGYEYKNGECVSTHIKPVVCPKNYVWLIDRCVPVPECESGTYWNGIMCATRCDPGYDLIDNVCVKKTCPIGYTFIGGVCRPPPTECDVGFVLRPDGFCEKRRCRTGEILINGVCICQPGYERRGNECVRIVITTPTPSPRPIVTTTTTQPFRPTLPTPGPTIFPPGPILPPTQPPLLNLCPPGFLFYRDKCYKCPPGYSFCNGLCARQTCNQPMPIPPITPPAYIPQPPPNINININFTRPHYPPPPPAREGKAYNIVNHVEPINNTIYNINNITHPVTLNNVQENNIFIYTQTRCADGSLRTTVIKNNQTVSGCDDSEKVSNDKPKSDPGQGSDEEPERCCEIITPRQCKKRSENQWICSHRRYRYCGKFCISDRLYMRPPETTWNNHILTIAPHPTNTWARPCYGRNCPPVDCGGCTNGSFDCSQQCYTYPCSGGGCTYVDQDEFCSNVQGEMCD